MSTPSPVRIALTLGDPHGIGAEITLRALAAQAAADSVVTLLGSRDALAAAARVTGIAAETGPRLRTSFAPDEGDAAALWALEEACRLARDGAADAIVTAPVQKSGLARVGFAFPGQTEFLGDRLGVGAEGTTMLLAGRELRVALVTTHLPLREVPGAVTAERVEAAIRRLHDGLRDAYGLPRPRIAVLGVNPHAGEEGMFGDEDGTRVRPAVLRCAADGIDCRGPLPGDGTFAPRARAAFDGFVACYHDQGLAALKALEGGRAVNVTLGLPVPRTSPDHGTARDIAGRGVADAESMAEALRLAVRWARSRAASRPASR